MRKMKLEQDSIVIANPMSTGSRTALFVREVSRDLKATSNGGTEFYCQ